MTIPKVSTYVKGLDEILDGGLPKHRTTLIVGGPGSGKTVLGLEFIYRSAVDGIPGIYVTFEETAEAVRVNAKTLGWDLESLEQKGLIRLIEGKVSPESVLAGEFNLKGLLAILEGQTNAIKAQFIVIDALDVILKLMDNPLRERNELYMLHDWLNDKRMTAVLTLKTQETAIGGGRYIPISSTKTA